MNIEEYEDALAAELPNHLSSNWNVKVTNFAAASPNDAVVAGTEINLNPVVGNEQLDPRVRPVAADEATATLSLIFNSAPQAPRSLFNTLYTEVKACLNALTRSRPEHWTLASMTREVEAMAEAPVRTIECVVNVETIAGARA